MLFKINLVPKIMLLWRDLFEWHIVEICLLKHHVFWILCLLTSWACLLGSILKLIFRWNVQLVIFLKYLFKWLAEVLIFCTMEKKDVSSPKSFAVVDRLPDRSLMWIKNDSVPCMVCLFKTTCCFLKLRKSVIIFKILSDIPF